MRTTFLLALLLLLAVPAAAKPEEAEVVPALLAAFDALGVKPEAVRVRDVAFWKQWAPRLRASGRMVEGVALPTGRDPLRPTLVDRALRAPLDAVRFGLGIAEGKPPEPLAACFGGGEYVELPAGDDPLPADVEVPGAVRRLAVALAGLEDAALAALPEGSLHARMPHWMVSGLDAGEVGEARAAFDRFGTTDLLPLVRQVLALCREARSVCASGEGFSASQPLRVETPRGLVIVGTRGKDVHEEDAWLLVDPGGDDVYSNNAGGTGTGRRAALCVDVAGDDRYESEAPFSQGAAREGLGILLDLAGNDVYRGGSFCQGAALGGAGVLADDEGNDVFEASEFAQGAAAFGFGLLLSGRGDDTYALDHLGQGLGRTAGYGVLRDDAGDDRYVARPTHESTYSQWTGGRTVHWSFAQGCGFGFYARYEEALPDGNRGLVIRDLLPGGVGVLRDASGDDVYEGSMYAQGTAYFYGLGICADLGGDDVYTATWYGQGAAPHFAAGILVDACGNDRYTGMHQVQGNGRDFSTAVLLDLAGDDVYVAEDRVQGCGDHKDGYGLFVDAAGSDRYAAKRRSARGWATLVKPREQPTEEVPYADYGVFLDLGGEDVYEGRAAGQDGETWIQETTRRGIGVDR